jgi:cyclase
MKTTMPRVLSSTLCILLWCGAAAPQDAIPTGGPLPDIRGFNDKVDDPNAVAAIEMVVRHVAGKVYVIAGAGGNMTVMAGDDGIFIVDSSYAVFYEQIMALIRRISDRPIRFIVNTHAHPDHTGNNANFTRDGAVIVTPPNTRQALIKADSGSGLTDGLPVITSTEPMTFHFNGEEIIFVPLKPSHTNGDVAVYFTGSDVWAFGDVYRTDYPSLNTSAGGTIENFESIYNMALDMTTPKTVFVPGHGQLSSREDLRALTDAVIVIHARFRDMVAQGMTLDEIMKARPSREFDARFASENKSADTGNTVDRVYRRFYEDVSRELAQHK